MANASIGGLISGLDTATIISQLMQLEAQPQANLQTRVSSEQRAITSLQTFNAKLASITTKAAELAKASSWGGVAATSSNDKVSVTADAGSAAGELSFTVNSVATAARASYATTGASGDVVATPDTEVTLTFDDGRTTQTFNTGDGTLQGIADALNETSGARATLIRVGTAGDGSTPTYRLQVASTTTGAASGFTLTNADASPFLGGTATSNAGTDASITVDGETTPLTSSSNTITDLLPGVDVTLKAGATGATTLSLAVDSTAMTSKVKGLVDAVNSALSDVASLTGYDAATKTAGLLAGDTMVRGVGTQLVSTVIAGIGGTSLASLGIQSTRDGTLVFDEDAFKAAYEADPTGTAAKFTVPADPAAPGAVVGLASKLETLAKSFSDSVDGTVTSAIKGRTSVVDRMNDDIAGWDVRLEQRRSSLERQYAALEVALGKLQSQSSWLSSQISSLPTISSGE